MSEIKLFLPYVQKEKKYYLFGFVGSLFRFLIPLFVPLILKYIFDQLLQNGEMSQSDKFEQLLYIAIGMIIVFIFIRTPMEYLRQYCIQQGNKNIIKRLRKETFKKVQSLDAKYFVDY